MKISTIEISAQGGSTSVRISSPQFPQTLAGVLWRYDASKNPDGKAGEFTPGIPTVPLGGSSAIDGKFYLIEGAVLHQNDNPPTPYQVVVSFTQDGNVIHEEVPEENGTGQLGSEDAVFAYRFEMRAKP